MDLALQVVRVELRHAKFCSKSDHDQFAMLAAVHLVMTRPLATVSIAMCLSPTAGLAFADRRNLFDQFVHLSCSSLAPAKDDRTFQKTRLPARNSENLTKPDFLAAVKKAIEQIGVKADRTFEIGRRWPVDTRELREKTGPNARQCVCD